MDVKNIIQNVKKYIEERGLIYSPGVIESLFLSLKTRPFVVISGKSGSGKSSLARIFAEALGANASNGRFKLISVCSDWKSPARFIGNVTSDGKFVPGLCTAFIQRAISDPELPYFLCLDEINLSRPELYLSSFLSVFETRRRNEEGTIVTDCFFDNDSFGNDISASYSYGGIYIPENLYIIGTINNDDSSYVPTIRFIDRVHVIELNSHNVSVEYDFDNLHNPRKQKPIDATNSLLKSEYVTLDECKADLEHLEYVSRFLQNINEFLRFSDSSLSYRTRDTILLFILYCRRYELMSDESSVDMIILQKILPRISGMNKSVKEILIELFGECMKRNANYGENYPNTSFKMYSIVRGSGCRYIRSAQKIAMMLRRYEEDGFTSYWYN